MPVRESLPDEGPILRGPILLGSNLLESNLPGSVLPGSLLASIAENSETVKKYDFVPDDERVDDATTGWADGGDPDGLAMGDSSEPRLPASAIPGLSLLGLTSEQSTPLVIDGAASPRPAFADADPERPGHLGRLVHPGSPERQAPGGEEPGGEERGRVQALDPHTVNQIAAGEVVERPASVVKELIENALDAGATHITVELEESGRRLIRVTDDGVGMTERDALSSLQRHATSKIRVVEDLAQVGTLGFRGEAIPSIASVSHFEISTAATDGRRVVLTVDGGALAPIAYAAGPRGTVVTVRDLFFNVPARRKFLRSDTTELGQILDHASRYAIAYPDVAIRVTHRSESGRAKSDRTKASGESDHPGQLALDAPGRGDRREAVAYAWSRELARSLVEIDANLAGMRLRGFVSPPHVTKTTRGYQYLYVNGRPVRSRQLTAAVDVAFREITPERRFPLLVLMIEIDPALIDVNVSPTKSEVRFQHEGAVFDAIRHAIKQSLVQHGMMPDLRRVAAVNAMVRENARGGQGFDDSGAAPTGDELFVGGTGARFASSALLPGMLASELFVAGTPSLGDWNGDRNTARVDFSAAGATSLGPAEGNPFGLEQNGAAMGPPGEGMAAGAKAPDSPLSAGTAGDAPENLGTSSGIAGVGGAMPVGDQPGTNAPLCLDSVAPDFPAAGFAEFLLSLRIIGQAMRLVILAESPAIPGDVGRGIAVVPAALVMIDQHAAHERILWEKICLHRGVAPIEQQHLLVPAVVELDRRAAILLRERLDEIRQIGFDVEPFGGGPEGGASFLIRAVPAALRGKDPSRIFRDLADELVESVAARRIVPTRELVWITTACRMAIKAGDTLSMPEMEELIRQLAACENPYLCPHGRPIVVRMDREATGRLFKR